MFRFLRRQAVLRQPFPTAWLSVLEREVPWYVHLPPELQVRLQTRIQIFLGEKAFVGCGGLEVTDRMRVVIAAQACRLELHHTPTHFPDCQTLFVYPGAFVSAFTRVLPGGVVQQEPVIRVGESWHRGSVVLAWDAVEAALYEDPGGRNVVLHEFAHQLDGGDGPPDGVPLLRDRAAYARWTRVMGAALERLRRALWFGFAPIDPYAATSPPEFFAVTTELYFEVPEQLRAFSPDVFALLEDYYGALPAASSQLLN